MKTASKPTIPRRTRAIFAKVIKQITEHPETYNQLNGCAPECGTPSCILGWAGHFAGLNKWTKHDPLNLSGVLGVPSESLRRLFLTMYWPREYADDYYWGGNLSEVAVNRIKHWLKTGGQE